MANQRAVGCRLVKTATVEIKCINIVHITGAHWAYLWNTGWNPSRLTACLNFAQLIGANAVKITGNGIGPDVASNTAYTDNYPDDVTFRSRIQWFFAQCRAMGLKVYWNLNSEPGRWLGADGSQGAASLPISPRWSVGCTMTGGPARGDRHPERAQRHVEPAQHLGRHAEPGGAGDG